MYTTVRYSESRRMNHDESHSQILDKIYGGVPVDVIVDSDDDEGHDDSRLINGEGSHQHHILEICDDVNESHVMPLHTLEKAKSDPLVIKAALNDSIKFSLEKRCLSHDDITDEFGVNERSVVPVPLHRLGSSDTKYSEPVSVVVPSREHLLMYPFYSTPLSLENTKNAFWAFREKLYEMGFEEQAEAALVHTQCLSVEDAVDFIMANLDTAIWHRFQPDLRPTGGMDCAACGKSKDQHLLDEDGVKVAGGVNEDFYQDYYQDASFVQSGGESEPNSPNYAQAGSLVTFLHHQTSLNEDQALMSEDEHDGSHLQPKTPTDHTRIRLSSGIDYFMKNGTTLQTYPDHDDGSTQRCAICFDEKPTDVFIKTECGHEYCTECLAGHYRAKTNDGDVLKVKCIDPGCEREVKEEEILQFLDAETQEKFRKFKQRKLLMLNENVRFCPMVDCEGFMMGSRLKPKLKCPECDVHICFNCGQQWHGYLTKCAAAQEAHDANDDERKYAQWAQDKGDELQKCPKCKIAIEKNEGCNHMTCISCGYEFCWLCRGKYTDNHYAAWNLMGCPGAQFDDRWCSIHRCPRCIPMLCRRVLVILCLVLLLLSCSPLLFLGCLFMCVMSVLLCRFGFDLDEWDLDW